MIAWGHTVSRWLRRLRGRSEHLRHEVHDQLPVLPVLSSQLREVASQIEKGVVDTCQTFQGMAVRAQDSVTTARAAMGDDAAGGGSFSSLVATAQQTLETLLERSIRSAELSRQAAERVQRAEKAMSDVVAISRQVDQIAFGIKILAINAKIQSVHVGAEGSGFGVVADEIARHAEESTKIADSIRDTVHAQLDGIRQTRETLTELASTSVAGADQSQRDVRQALDVLTSTHARMHASVGQAADTSRELAEDIAGAVTHLQFQDRVTQRLSHVFEGIERVHAALAAAAGHDAAAPAPSQALSRLQSSYTMAEEHHVVALRPTGTDGPAPAGAGGSIELF